MCYAETKLFHVVLASQVGFEMIDSISKTQGIVMNTIQLKALVGIGSIGEVPILVVKPQAYMNYSGEAVCSHHLCLLS
ncbi:putative aminoacyl-tRNA hydrolase [Rosa chinensis]|uniref:Putative aminoacyl-tRNA hydrolase n=1 Tax=Rosa chinensis TaxID=74649 RepID=A0A2P6QFA3_ROSCH|nr:putative aminoacyl-tRNA hydrolase [Rosa chinensis]